MKNNLSFRQSEKKENIRDKFQKATTLMDLKEALVKEEYEQCAELIQKAKNYGATQVEIKEVLESYVRRIKLNREIGASQRN